MNSTVKHYPRNVYLRMHRKSACFETFKSLYQKWLPTRVGIVSKSAIESYRIAYDHIQSIANIPINLIKYSDMQCVIDSMRDNGLSYASAKKVRTLLSLLSKYAIVNDIDIKDYTPFLSLGHDVSVYPHLPFTRQQINRLWSLNTTDTYRPTRHRERSYEPVPAAPEPESELTTVPRRRIQVRPRRGGCVGSRTRHCYRSFPVRAQQPNYEHFQAHDSQQHRSKTV